IVNDDINIQFQQLFIAITDFMQNSNQDTLLYAFEIALGSFVSLGYTQNDLNEAYLLKNNTNHQRIVNNY
ncbi:dUTP diphosphatase, partial [Mycoplasma nasistruthionis]